MKIKYKEHIEEILKGEINTDKIQEVNPKIWEVVQITHLEKYFDHTEIQFADPSGNQYFAKVRGYDDYPPGNTIIRKAILYGTERVSMEGYFTDNITWEEVRKALRSLKLAI